jgi:hypothetical protein
MDEKMRYTTLLALAATVTLAACGSSPDARTTPALSLDAGVRSTPAKKPKPAKIEVNPPALTFGTAGAQTFAVKEAKYTGVLKVDSSNPNVAIVTPAEHLGPKATFTVTPNGGGRSTIRVRDSHGHSVTVKISVSGAIIIVDGRKADGSVK